MESSGIGLVEKKSVLAYLAGLKDWFVKAYRVFFPPSASFIRHIGVYN